jgi:hypothetical protein
MNPHVSGSDPMADVLFVLVTLAGFAAVARAGDGVAKL